MRSFDHPPHTATVPSNHIRYLLGTTASDNIATIAKIDVRMFAEINPQAISFYELPPPKAR
jgi:hypothetical protein